MSVGRGRGATHIMPRRTLGPRGYWVAARPCWLLQERRQHAAIDAGQAAQFLDRHALVRLVHAGADQAELGDGAVAGDEAGVGGAAAGVALRVRRRSRVRWRRSSLSMTGPGWVTNDSPLIAMSRSNLSPACWASAARSQADRSLPVWSSLKRMFSMARAAAGMTLVTGLPTSIEVTCKVEGSNQSVPASTGAAVRAVRARSRRWTGLSARCGIGDVALRAVHGDLGVQAAAAADLHHVAEADGAGRLADQAEVGDVAVVAHPRQHTHGAVGGDAFLVAGDEQADRAVQGGPAARWSAAAATKAAMAPFMSQAPRP